MNLCHTVQLARSAPRALDSTTILALQAHSGNAALAGLLGSTEARPPIALSRTPTDDAPTGSVSNAADGSATLIDLRAHPRFGGGRGNAPALRAPIVQLQSGVACPEPPVAAPPIAPHDDPGFTAVTERVEGVAAEAKKHPPPRSKANEAQAAAVAPATEGPSHAAAAQVDDMHAQKPGTFDKKAFTAAVHTAIEAATPKTMDEVDTFKSSGKPGSIGTQVAGVVGSSKDAAAKDIKDTNQAAPDSSKAETKPATPVPQESPGGPPGDVGAGQAMPTPKPADQVHLDHTRCETDSKLAEAKVTDQTVADSNEPEFHAAMEAKEQADAHAATAPQAVRQSEQGTLEQSKSGAAAEANVGTAGMHDVKASALTATARHQAQGKAKNEAARAEVSAHINHIYDTTKSDVDKILTDLDSKVDDAFKQGEKTAHDAFVNHVDEKKTAYFDKRYTGIEGALLWAKDKLTSPPPEVNAFIDEGRTLYLAQMDGVIDRVADLVGAQLTAAKTRIAAGRQQITTYVAGLKGDLKEVGQKAEADIGAKFDQLDQDVESKQGAVVDSLAQKYVEARNAVDAEVNTMKEDDKGLLDKAKDAVSGMVDTVLKMKAMLEGVLAKAGDVLDTIIAKPLAFLDNLGAAVKQGLGNFVSNIATHFEAGLSGWILGELADAGITMPEHFDFKGVLHLVAQVLGFTWDHIKELATDILGPEIVAMIEKGHAALEKVLQIFDVIKKEGLAGIWHMIQDKLSELEDSVLGQIKSFVVTKVITAGVTWIVSMLNPASAFIKACKAIYDFVMFLVERGQQIVEFVNAILDNLAAIASGAIGSAAGLVESVLAKALPLAISMLASLLGLGGLSEKIKEVINAVRAPVDKAIRWLLTTVVKPIAKLAMKGIGWVTGKVKAGVAWVKGKAKAGMGKLKEKFGKKGEEPSVSVRKRVAPAVRAITSKRYSEVAEFDGELRRVFQQYKPMGLKSLYVASVSDDPEVPFAIVAEASPAKPVTLVKWKELFEKGDSHDKDAEKFARAGDSTYAVLLVNKRQRTQVVRNESKKDRHAEDNILLSDGWSDSLIEARRLAHLPKPRATTITLVINRTPCHLRCTPKLAKELEIFRNGFETPAAQKVVHFYLVSTGVYETHGELANREEGGPTTNSDLAELMAAGWHLQGLQVRDRPTSRGSILSEYVKRMLGQLRRVKEGG